MRGPGQVNSASVTQMPSPWLSTARRSTVEERAQQPRFVGRAYPAVDRRRQVGDPAVDALGVDQTAALDDRRPVHLTIRLVDEEESRTLNRTYRGKDKATNVLSFEADLPPEVDIPLLGDIVVCVPVVQREAEQQSKTLEAHWAHMVIHGMLHLQGHDHQQPDQAAQMEALEIEILQSLGHTNPYV